MTEEQPEFERLIIAAAEQQGRSTVAISILTGALPGHPNEVHWAHGFDVPMPESAGDAPFVVHLDTRQMDAATFAAALRKLAGEIEKRGLGIVCCDVPGYGQWTLQEMVSGGVSLAPQDETAMRALVEAEGRQPGETTH